jgi:hypothetical protein
MDPLEQLRAEAFGTDESSLVLPVVDPIEAHYVVTCNEPPDDPWVAADQTLATVTPLDLLDDVRSLTRSACGIAIVEAWEAPPLRWQLIASAGGDAAQIVRAQGARWHLLIRSAGHPGRRMVHQWAALAVARALQARTGGVLIDPVVDRLIPRFVRSARSNDVLADHRRDLLSQWVWVHHSVEDGGTHWMTTDGLKRFGLPELSTHGVPAPSVQDACYLLMGMAHRLVIDQAATIGHLPRPPAFRAVPRRWTLTRKDWAATYPPASELGWMQQCIVSLSETAHDSGRGVPMLEVA